MLATIAALVAGLVFGTGLVVSGMVNPAKVLGFLDVAGAWDPSLAFVMIGAVSVAAVGFAIARRRSRPVAAPAFRWPPKVAIDGRLVLGMAIFGVGWGLVGFCPGPAVAAVTLNWPGAALFVVAMLAGMALFELVGLLLRRATRQRARSTA
jgi:uncharacterized protein